MLSLRIEVLSDSGKWETVHRRTPATGLGLNEIQCPSGALTLAILW